MVTLSKQTIIVGTNKFDYDINGLSTDEKPFKINGVPIGENSIFFELDTGDFYYLKQQGSSTTTRISFLNETIDDWYNADNKYVFQDIDIGDNPLPETINVVWDGVEYVCEMYHDSLSDSDKYGAHLDGETGYYDFTEYPFAISVAYSDDEHVYTAEICCAYEEDETIVHSVEVYVNETVVVEGEWAKVGGGDTPTPTESNLIIIHSTETDDSVFSDVEMSASEIIEAVASGKGVMVNLARIDGARDILYYADNNYGEAFFYNCKGSTYGVDGNELYLD